MHNMEGRFKKIYELNAIKLAYMGDAVYTLYVREHFILNTDKKNSQLNSAVNKIVCAKAQAKLIEDILLNLSDDEKDIVNRARNLHFNNIAKNSTLEEYSKATEFEALIGYRNLTEQFDKINNVVERSIRSYYDSGRN